MLLLLLLLLLQLLFFFFFFSTKGEGGNEGPNRRAHPFPIHPAAAVFVGVEADVHHRVNEGCKVLGALKGIIKNRGLGMNVKKVLYEKVVVPTAMYGSESWGVKVT